MTDKLIFAAGAVIGAAITALFSHLVAVIDLWENYDEEGES